jgi:hypothetical protein
MRRLRLGQLSDMPRAQPLAFLLILAACVTPSGAPDKISMTEGSWGEMRGAWTIERSGVGHFTPHEGSDGAFPVSPEQFARVQALLQPIERDVGRDLPCGPGPTDGPYGAITWTRHGVDAVLPWTTGCVSPERSQILHSMEAASEAVRVIAGAH